MYKDCEVCGTTFEVASRYSYKKYCSNSCGNTARGRRWKALHPDTVRALRRKEAQNWERRICSTIKHRAKCNNIPFDIDPTDIIMPKICPVLGIPIQRTVGKGSGYWTNNPSVDRINPDLGYVKGNVRVISHRANLLKSNATLEELELILEDAKKLRDV